MEAGGILVLGKRGKLSSLTSITGQGSNDNQTSISAKY